MSLSKWNGAFHLSSACSIHFLSSHTHFSLVTATSLSGDEHFSHLSLACRDESQVAIRFLSFVCKFILFSSYWLPSSMNRNLSDLEPNLAKKQALTLNLVWKFVLINRVQKYVKLVLFVWWYIIKLKRKRWKYHPGKPFSCYWRTIWVQL